jgi:cbb3-type cytochrome oxidase subunit 3
MSTEHDLEYGPTPAGAQYEHTDVDVSIGYTFAIWLGVAMLLSVALVYGVFWVFEDRKVEADEAAQQFPLAAGQEKEPPSPRLQTQPFKDVYLLKQGQGEHLETFGWTDKANGVVHISIERAMELTREHLSARPNPQAAPASVVQDSSSGRTSGVR